MFTAQLPPRATTSVTSNVMYLSISETTLHSDYIVTQDSVIQTRANPVQRFPLHQGLLEDKHRIITTFHRSQAEYQDNNQVHHLTHYILYLSGCVHHLGNVEFPAQLPPRATTSVTSNVMYLSISETTLHPDYIVTQTPHHPDTS